MNALALSIAYLRRRPLNTALNLALLAIGVGTIALLLLFTNQLNQRLERDATGIDMVVGAKGSPMQLILSSLFHVDIPTGNVRIADARALTTNPMVREVIPLALGDAFRSYRIVGTEPSYTAHYGATLADGRWWHEPLEATVGARAASEGGLAVGSSFAGAHGMTGGGAAHGETPYRVVGVMAPTGTVLDRLILTSIESVWDVHGLAPSDHGDGAAPGDHGDHAGHDEPAQAGADTDHAAVEPADGRVGTAAGILETGAPDQEVTALLVKFRTPIAAAQLPRLINMTTPMQAALPGYEIARLMKLVGAGIDGFRAFAVILVVSAGLGIFAALYNALAQRRYDIAIMRALGASRAVVLRQILLEGALLALAGAALGLLLGHATAEIAGGWLWREHQIALSGLSWIAAETWLIVMALALGLLAALLPALQAYRIDISSVLARG